MNAQQADFIPHPRTKLLVWNDIFRNIWLKSKKILKNRPKCELVHRHSEKRVL